jgi:hypothetical protein
MSVSPQEYGVLAIENSVLKDSRLRCRRSLACRIDWNYHRRISVIKSFEETLMVLGTIFGLLFEISQDGTEMLKVVFSLAR